MSEVMNVQKKNVVIIGAGASGLAAAVFAAREGASVTVLEKNKKAGTKLLRTGNGHCNLTNLGNPSGKYDNVFGEKVLEEFTVRQTLAFFESIGVLTRARDGWVYPYNEEASTVLRALLCACEREGVRIHTDCEAVSIERRNGSFLVITENWQYEADSVILACGSPAGLAKEKARHGIAAQLGHSIRPVLPALVGLRTGRKELLRCAGTRARVLATLYVDGVPVDQERGQIQFASKGISGICIMNLSTQAVRELSEGHSAGIGLDFLAEGHSAEIGLDFLAGGPGAEIGLDLLTGGHSAETSHDFPGGYQKEEASDSGTISDEKIVKTLRSLLPEKLYPVVFEGIPAKAYEEASNAASAKYAEDIRHRLTDFRLPVTGPLAMAEAQAASGGIRTDEVDPETMESKLVPGLFITGEMLDVTGKCGGWNLQFAWSTGALAGKAAAGCTL